MLFLLVMLLVVVLSITACALLGRGCGSLAEKGLRRTSLPKALRGFASISGAGAVAVYAWGLLGVAGAIMEAEDGGRTRRPIGPAVRPVGSSGSGAATGSSTTR